MIIFLAVTKKSYTPSEKWIHIEFNQIFTRIAGNNKLIIVRMITLYALSREGTSEMRDQLHTGHNNSKTNMLGGCMEWKQKQRVYAGYKDP